MHNDALALPKQWRNASFNCRTLLALPRWRKCLRYSTLQREYFLVTVTGRLALLSCVLVGCSSDPRHTEQEFSDATIFGAHVTAYEKAFSGGELLTADARFRFRDGTEEATTITVTYDGPVDDPSGYCEFSIDDKRKPIDDEHKPKRIVRPCGGAGDSGIDFTFGDVSVSLKCHVNQDFAPLSEFQIDAISPLDSIDYVRGLGPSADSEGEGQ